MGLVTLARARLAAQVPGLAGRVGGALDLSRLIATGAFPTATPYAFATLGGIDAGPEDAATGVHRQALTRLLAVILVVRSHDATGARALDDVEALIDQVVEGLAGWTPDGANDALSLRRCQLRSAEGGTFTYELTFALPDQLRIAT